MSDQNAQSSSNQPVNGTRPMTPNQKLVMWLVIAAIPVGILIYALSNRNSTNMAAVDKNAVVNEKPSQSNNGAVPPVTSTTPSETTTPPTPSQTPAVPVTASAYKDGTYSATGSYMSPGGAEEVGVTLMVKDGVVTDSTFETKAARPMSVNFQNQFAGGYKEFVVGKKLDEINVGKVSGSSLTPKGFNDAVAKIKAQAKS